MTMAGFPTKFVESVSCGVPVITTETSDLKKFCQQRNNGAILPAENFSEELRNFLDSVPTQGRINVDRNAFDYRNYLEQFRDFLGR